MNYDDITDNLYPAWHARALCNGMQPDIWYPAATGSTPRTQAVVEARRICRQCPVRRECLDDAIATRQQWGIWGGQDFEGKRKSDVA